MDAKLNEILDTIKRLEKLERSSTVKTLLGRDFFQQSGMESSESNLNPRRANTFGKGYLDERLYISSEEEDEGGDTTDFSQRGYTTEEAHRGGGEEDKKKSPREIESRGVGEGVEGKSSQEEPRQQENKKENSENAGEEYEKKPVIIRKNKKGYHKPIKILLKNREESEDLMKEEDGKQKEEDKKRPREEEQKEEDLFSNEKKEEDFYDIDFETHMENEYEKQHEKEFEEWEDGYRTPPSYSRTRGLFEDFQLNIQNQIPFSHPQSIAGIPLRSNISIQIRSEDYPSPPAILRRKNKGNGKVRKNIVFKPYRSLESSV